MFPYLITNKIIHPLRCKLVKWHKDVAFQAAKLASTEWSSREDLLLLQQQKLKKLCKTAYSNCTFYKKRFKDAGLEPDDVNLDVLSKMPVLDKTIIRENFNGIINREYPKNEMHKNSTGGSAGDPLVFYLSRNSVISKEAIVKRLHSSHLGMKQGLPFVSLWGASLDIPSVADSLKSRTLNYLYNKRSIDAYNASNKLFETEHLKFKQNPPFLLLSYSNILYEFALYIQRNNKSYLDIPSVISSAGSLYDFQREVIQQNISKNVFNCYGSREFGCIAHECNVHEGLHINMERFIIEIDDPDKDGIGNILVTDLENLAFPFIRYKISDIGQLTNTECTCGRHSVMFSKLIGREMDIIRTPSGRMISGLRFPSIFCLFPDILLGQVIQDRIDRIEIRIKLQEGSSLRNVEALINKIKVEVNNELMVSVNAEEEFVVNITGKYRPVISRIE